MFDIYLTPASLMYFNQTLMGILISVYLIFELYRSQRVTMHMRLIISFFVGLTVFSVLLFFDVSLLPTQRLPMVYWQNTILGITLTLLLQFSYHYPSLQPGRIWLSRLALGVGIAYSAGEGLFAVYRFELLRHGDVLYRPDIADYALVVLLIWLILNFVTRWNQINRNFALIFLIALGVAGVNVLHTFYLVSTTINRLSIATGILVCMFLFAINYLISEGNYISFSTKLAGGLLTGLMVALSGLSWLTAPVYAARYIPAFVQLRSLIFVPNADNSYTARPTAFVWREATGKALKDTTPTNDWSTAYPFAFNFFGERVTHVFVNSNCALTINQPPALRNFEYLYGNMPGIFPLYSTYELEEPASDIQVSVTPDELIVTCAPLRFGYFPEHEIQVQVVVQRSGVIEFQYRALPANLPYLLDNRPQASVWFIGLHSGKQSPPPKQVNFLDGVVQSNSSGFIQDEFLLWRKYIHDFLQPTWVFSLLVSIVFVIGLPISLNISLFKPLRNLQYSIQRTEAHQPFEPVPIAYYDEVGYLTKAFNHLHIQIEQLIETLETRVEQRTADLLAANQQLRQLSIAVEQSPSSIMITDLTGKILYVNATFTKNSGYTAVEVLGKKPNLLKSGHTLNSIYAELWQTICNGDIWRGELINRKKNGDLFWEWTIIAPIYDEHNQISHFVAVKEDITQRKQMEEALRDSEKRYHEVFDLASDAIFIIAIPSGKILEGNRATIELYGYPYEQLCSLNETDLIADIQPRIQELFAAPNPDNPFSKALVWHRDSKGNKFPVEITAQQIEWKGLSAKLMAVRNNTERYQHLIELEQLATTDGLTGIFNRRYFFEQARKIFAASQQTPFALTGLMIDIDHFKRFNDTYGHAVGDLAILHMVETVSAQLRATDLFARYGGEEFVVLLPRTDVKIACEIAERLNKTLANTPLLLPNNENVSIHISIGIAQITKSMTSIDELLHNADEALYRAKQAGRNCWRVFE